MNKIDSLHINNFKFFQLQEPLKLGGNHLLLYGENGSGKSSIYWSLYTLFKESIKSKDEDIKKYFSKKIKKIDSLVNIHSIETAPGSDDYGSFIEVVTTDIPPKKFRISRNEVAIRGDKDAQSINYSSDFINYRLLMRLSSFRHSNDIDLFDLFVEHVFKYVQFSKVEITRDGKREGYTNAFDIWKQIERGLEYIDSVRSKIPKKILANSNNKYYKEYGAMIKTFNNNLNKLIDYINIYGPQYFARLGYDIQYSLNLETLTSFTRKPNKFELIPFVLRIKIGEYEGVIDVVDKPHSFLNEAKLSALAISIRLAVLNQKLKENNLKFIVLDDLLISLDMCNREKVLDLLLSSEFAENYQLLILTHDRLFYQMAKHKIKEYQQINWVYYEMYEKQELGKSQPLLLEEVGYLGKAHKYLALNELDIVANFLRKEAEAFCKKMLPLRLSLSQDGTYKELGTLINISLEYAKQNGMSEYYFQKLNKHRIFLLNPGSHDSYDVPKYKVELQECFDNLKEINQISCKVILAKKSKLHFELTNGINLYKINITVYEDAKLIKEPLKDSFIPKIFINYDVYLDGVKTKAQVQHGIESLKKLYDNFYAWSDKTKSVDYWSGIVISDSGALLDTLRVF